MRRDLAAKEPGDQTGADRNTYASNETPVRHAAITFSTI